MENFDKSFWSVKLRLILRPVIEKKKKSQLDEKKNEKLWSCGADGWRGGVWKADGRGRSISLFQLLAGTNTDDKVATLSLFLSPLSRSLFSFPLHFPRIWFPSFFLYHITRADVACSLWHLLIVQGKSPATSPPILLGWIPPRIIHHMEITHPLEIRDSQSRMYWMELKIYITWQCFCLQSMCRRTVGAILLHFTHYVTVCRVKTLIFIHITSILHCPYNLD